MNPPAPTPLDLDILAKLLTGGGLDPASIDAPRSEVEAALRRLRSLGCIIEHTDRDTVRLVRSGLGVWIDYAEHAMRRAGIARKVEVYRSTASTQDIAKLHPDERVVILADEQTAGRGRLGRRWIAPPGTTVLMSMTHPLAPDESPDRITLAASVAVAHVVEGLTWNTGIQIKWPNDVMVDGRKLAGILVETVTSRAGRTAIVGVGVNVHQDAEDFASYPPELRDRVTSLARLGCTADRLLVATRLAERIDATLRLPDTNLLHEWRRRNLMHAQRVRLRSGDDVIEGEVIDLDPHDGLIVRRDDGAIVHLPSATTTVLQE